MIARLLEFSVCFHLLRVCLYDSLKHMIEARTRSNMQLGF